MFRATTQPYYASPVVTDDPANVMLTPEGTARQFRMKLPDKPLVALLALGIRDGLNIASTMAIQTSIDCPKNIRYWN